MNREEALRLVKTQITEHRYQHTLGVMETSIALAERYGADQKKAELAAIFHDYAKFRAKDEMKEIIASQKMNPNLLAFNSELWHAPAGAYLVETEAGVTDREILDAIRYHTSGKVKMALLDKIVFLADYIEPGRAFQGVDEVRNTAKENLDLAVIEALRNTIFFLMKRNQAVYPDTFEAYNDLILNSKEKIQ
ncbi:HD domain-containing protein [Peribacillus cavernae]|uniref:bis(5'-nucleosyl)-tetraphosphatase (symmetrical) n=1 Tax=Peribacillus cavernae TaxID=1674310 RepID=A0A433HWH6_9BACI|nr:bis(5'-nucleosyl)-tetraphosphatase (symmetrical) YqeK [Peribacillus cavernae]MDQ0218231.1 putative HD superfamily hydrolase involved in NAD metabolism [Peribacillus cavernae]RUQ32635.1 HD domain-containing protein [Peribacillus cavernae]